MGSLPDGEKISKICLFVLTSSTNVIDGQTDRQTLHDSRPRLCIASRGENQTIIDCLQLSDTKTRDVEKNDVISVKVVYTVFSFSG